MYADLDASLRSLIAALRKARVGSYAVVMENASLFGRANLLLIERAPIERGAYPAQVDPIEQCDRAAVHVHEFRGALHDCPTDSVPMNDL
jgi:hypothetical protein